MKKNKKPKLIGKRSIFIDKEVIIGENVIIYPNNIIRGKTIIGNNVILMPNNYISYSNIGDKVTIEYSHIENSIIDNNTHIGPYTRIRSNTHIGQNCKIGNFVEVKNSNIGNMTKASHLAYIGDSDVGQNCNIGCGAIFVNYNGKEKQKSTVGNNCFIGSNVNIIAPVKIASKTYICAGTTLTQNTNEYDFVIGRCKETIKNNYSHKYLKGEN